MSRVINRQAPGRERQRLRRTVAEALRRLAPISTLNGEARDLTALIVFCLRGIDETVEQAAEAWENRNYYLKADRFRGEWAWAGRTANLLTEALRAERWDELRLLLIGLHDKHFSDVKVIRTTRRSSEWRGAYDRLLGNGD